MFRLVYGRVATNANKQSFKSTNLFKNTSQKFTFRKFSTQIDLPQTADVVIIGGGSIGCNTLYQLSKRGVKAVLLERAKITSGTTWHTAGLVWRLRPNDVEIKLLATTRNLLQSLEKETGLNPGWIQNGGLFISHSEERTNEYKRLYTISKTFDIESHMLTPEETVKMVPLLNKDDFVAALYSPGDGVVDPSMFCGALIKGAAINGGKLIENCPVTSIFVDRSSTYPKITGVETEHGVIKTKCVVNSAGVWGRSIAQLVGLDLPLVPMKHGYVVSESIPGAEKMPNIRDHDASTYFRIQGSSICVGGYEQNPYILKDVPDDFQFGLYEMDVSMYEEHWTKASALCPALDKAGIKSTVYGPESFTPDHKPLLGEDPRMGGLFHACGLNSAGMMLSAGCANQLAIWITQGRPELSMFNYDVRRFTPLMRNDRSWAKETSHESYAKNYSIVFPHDQNLSGRNHKIDVFHEVLVANGAVMQQAQGWERPGYYLCNRTAPVRIYDWYGNYDHVKNEDKRYENQLDRDYTFDFSKNHDIIGEEALAVRENAGLFNQSYFAKMYLTGPDAQEAADWLFTANTRKEHEKVTYTCSLNAQGGVEADLTVTSLSEGLGTLVGPILKGRGFYMVAGGASGYHTVTHLKKQLEKKKFRAVITDVTDKLAILSMQGPKSLEILQAITESPITDEQFPFGMSHLVKINGHYCRVLRISFVGELGFELHIPTASGLPVYKRLMEIGKSFDLKHAGYRALYSLSCEKGYHLWNYDLRSDDNPIEANLGFVCRKDGEYLGRKVVDAVRKNGTKKRRAFFTINEKVPVFGLETIWRNGVAVGFLRRGEFGYALNTSIGIGYVSNPNEKYVNSEYLTSGTYEIEALGKRYPAELHLKSPFDPQNLRVLGIYEEHVREENED